MLVPHETVVKDLESDTVDKSAGLGASGSRFSPGAYSQAAFIEIKVSVHVHLCRVLDHVICRWRRISMTSGCNG